LQRRRDDHRDGGKRVRRRIELARILLGRGRRHLCRGLSTLPSETRGRVTRGASLPSVSVIVPCYNAVRTIGETIDSALAQVGAKVELIAVDDGSSDGSASVLRGYGDRITAVFGPNRGASAARNTGAARASGDWLVFLDSDDRLVSGTLAQRLATAERKGATGVICAWEDFDDGREDCSRARRIDVEALMRNPQTA